MRPQSSALVTIALIAGTSACSTEGAASPPQDEIAIKACLHELAGKAPLAPKDKLGQYAIARLQISAKPFGWTVTGRTAPRPGFPAREFGCRVTRAEQGVGTVSVTSDTRE